MNNILNTIGLCRRAGKLVTGFDAVIEEVRNPKGKVCGIIVTKDVSDKTKKELAFKTADFGVEIHQADITMEKVAVVLKKKTAVLAILDKGLFDSLKK